MTKSERLSAAFDLRAPDRTPTLGGWIAAPGTVMALTGRSEEAYWADPVAVTVEAYRKLDHDGLIGVFVPRRGGYRCVDHESLAARGQYGSPEDVVDWIDALPAPERVEDDFDEAAEYARFAEFLDGQQAVCGEMLSCPAHWDATPNFMWYTQFGYENYLAMLALYPDRGRRLFEYSGATARNKARLIARAIVEGKHPRAFLGGQDMCSQRGPLVSPDYLDEVYWPMLRHAMEPLLAVGARQVWHCDGDCRLLLDPIFDCGLAGLQGFQEECGMVLEELVQRRTRDGDPLLIFGPIAVTTTLVRRTPDEVRRKVREAIDICRDTASLVLFTSNTINPDVPVENIVAMCEAARG